MLIFWFLLKIAWVIQIYSKAFDKPSHNTGGNLT